MKNLNVLLAGVLLCLTTTVRAQEYYELRVYHHAKPSQAAATAGFLKEALVPALHQQGIAHVGVFGVIPEDTIHRNRTYVLIPYKSLQQMEKVQAALWKDEAFLKSGAPYLDAPFDQAPYDRIETILLRAFRDFPVMKEPALRGPRDKRVYELRSYEGATEKLYRAKVHMFNEGKEIPLFDRLNFNAVFYGEVLAGARMPNLMYITSFENMADRDSHWKLFVDDPAWKALVVKPEYQHTVARMDIIFLRPLPGSDY